jgi:prepilin-type N-terminal cleavage/methylation domain-containing protein
MTRFYKRKTLAQKAFSLIEISIVIVIIGILIAGVSEGIDLYNDSKLLRAKNLTRSSRVGRIPGLVAWYETTLENNFSAGTSAYSDIKNITENIFINRWKDINPSSLNLNHAIQNVSANQPKIIIDKESSLPVVNFVKTSLQFLSLPDGTVPYGNSEYTVIIVSNPNSFCTCAVLTSGNAGTNLANSFRYDIYNNGFHNYWFNVDIAINSSLTVKKNSIITIFYDLAQRKGYVNGALKVSVASSNRASTKINNRIGRSNSGDYFDGNIGEIIIYDRALSDKERADVELYLSKKWGIKI